jgi:hypothetical protein
MRHRFRSPVPARLTLAALFAPLLAAACAGMGSQDERYVFELAQRKYSQSVRWARFDKAGSFVAPEDFNDFRAQAAAFGDVRFTDYVIRQVEMGDDGRSATAQVTYYAYLRTQPVAVAVDEQQQWFREEGGRAWRVRSQFAQRPLAPGEGRF